MTEQQHPMVPPNILLNNWERDWEADRKEIDYLLTEAYQAGADAELEACCEWVAEESPVAAQDLRAARRPKPPSLKEQALEAFEVIKLEGNRAFVDLQYSDWAIIRKALEALPDD